MENIIKEILHKENIPFEKITKATSGFTNLVYFIDDKIVIKMSKDDNIKKKINKETTIYQNEVPMVNHTDLNDNVISEEQYNNFENEFFESFEKMMVNIDWLSNYSEINLEDLKESYNNFMIYSI